jgi:hypothetical protein
MELQNPLTAFWNKEAVDIHGGYQHPEKGYFVEVSSARNEKIPRQSISVWELSHHSEQTADAIFREVFGVPPMAAIKIDRKKGLKNEVLVVKILTNETAAVEATG